MKEYPLTLTLSRGVERVDKGKRFNGTPHPCPLQRNGEEIEREGR
jgi:hypothetical protein